jgi:hypothetical protein
MRILFGSNRTREGRVSGFNKVEGTEGRYSVWMRGVEESIREIINNPYIVWFMRRREI